MEIDAFLNDPKRNISIRETIRQVPPILNKDVFEWRNNERKRVEREKEKKRI